MDIADRAALIEFAFIGISTGFVIAKTAFNGNDRIVIPSKYNTTGMSGIRAKSGIAARKFFSHMRLLSFVLGSGGSL